MGTLNQHLTNYPRGRQYTYAVRIRGLPGVYSDGRASWDTWAQQRFSTNDYPYLARTDWSFKFESNPLEPLNVGGGISVELVKDPGGWVQQLFAPTREADFELLLDETSLGVNTSTFTVYDTAGISQGTKLYWGLETMNVSSVTGNEVQVERAYFGSTARRYQETNSDTNEVYTEGQRGLSTMDPLTSHPTIWRGRYVDIFMAELTDSGVLGEVWPIWAGRLDAFTLEGTSIRLTCDPLPASIVKDSWPQPMPKGTFQSDTIKVHVLPEDLFIQFAASNTALTSADGGIRLNLGTYDTASPANFTYETVPDVGAWYTLERIARLIQDTAVYGIINNPGSLGANANTLLNNFSIGVARSAEDGEPYQVMVARNQSSIHTAFRVNRGIFANLIKFITPLDLSSYALSWALPANETKEFGPFGRGSGFTLAAVGQGVLACYMDQRGRPFDEIRGGCYNEPSGHMRGFVKLTEGDNAELISFTNSGISQDGAFYADIEERGLGGTMPRSWGGGADPTSLEQIVVIHVGPSMSVADLLLYLLTSTAADVSRGPNGNYDYLGEWVGLGIPEDLIDIDGIISRLSISDMPRPSMFWIAEAGKGKDAVEEFLRANGVYLVTRRFTRDGVERFGLSVDVVDVPSVSSYTNTLRDSDISANKKPRVDINERLLINTIVLSPHYKFGTDAGDTGGMRYDYAEASIAKYGATKALKFEPNAIYNIFSGQFSGAYTNPEQVTAAIAAAIGLRWFGAFASGNYTIESDTPHGGWKFQAGDRVLIDLTGVPNPNGTDTFDGVIAKVIDVTHKHGTGAGARVSLRLSVVQSAELAPNVMVVSVDGPNVLTADQGLELTEEGVANPWSWLYQRGGEYAAFNHPVRRADPPFVDDIAPVRDTNWFNPERHEDHGRLFLRLWPRGNFSVYEEFEVLSMNGPTLTLDGAPSSSLLELSLNPIGGLKQVPLIGSFSSYANPSVLRASYTHLGSNDQKSLLGGVDKAKRWV